MRKLLGVVLVALLLPAALAAQSDTPGETRAAPKKIPRMITSDAARSAALVRVRADLAAGKLRAWGDPHVIPAGAVSAGETRFLKKGGKDGGPVYLVFATAAKGKGQVRVALNAESGAILNVMHRDWAGYTSPDWWVSRLEEDPVGTTSPRR